MVRIAPSEKTYLTVLIDIMPISGKIQGDLIDEDSDGAYDFFYNYSSEKKTEVDQDFDGRYLIDSTGDGKWDFIYDSETGELTDYESDGSESSTLQIYNMGVTFIAILALVSLMGSLIVVKKNKGGKEK